MLDRARASLSFAYDTLKAAGHQFGADRASRMAAALAYRTFFSLTPLLLVAVSVLGAVLGSSEQAQAEIHDAIDRVAGPEVAAAVDPFLTSVVVTSGTAAVIGVALLLWTASSLFLEMQHDLNDIFGVPYEHNIGLGRVVKKRAIGFIWAFGLGFALILVWALNVGWRFFGGLFPDELENVHLLIGFLTPLVSLVLLPVIIALIFQTMTLTKVPWRAAWYGGLFTSVTFLVAAYGTGLYFSWDDQTSALTIAGSVFVVLLMAFVLAGVFLYGAEVTRVYADYLSDGDVQQPLLRSAAENEKVETVVAEPPQALPTAAAVGFLAGLIVGWRRRERRTAQRSRK
jgi:membrane protein